MSEEEINARRKPISILEDLGIGFRGRREWLVLLTDRFRMNFEIKMNENYKLQQENKELNEKIEETKKFIKECELLDKSTYIDTTYYKYFKEIDKLLKGGK